ncbi:MAG: peptide chain release factor N(5)-glutamine methyltransferase [Chitinophagaceae bacterium]|nr:peptide chain release factor N(5)-glutamine methyltransferase [Chitinophagaceae bacterium]
MTMQETYQQLFIQLKKLYDDREAANIANMIFEQVTGMGKVDRLLQKSTSLSTIQQTKLKGFITELLKHKPVQYVLGEAWFAGMPFLVDEHVLIPRPETEELVQLVASSIMQRTTSIINILDIGTGSGCIPIAIKKLLPNAAITSIDVSEKALKIAQQNAINLHANINFQLLDFLEESNWNSLPIFDIIVSNPPYIKQSTSAAMAEHVLQYEPHVALFVPDNDALLFYKKIAAFSKNNLAKNGKIMVEINEALGAETIALFNDYGLNAQLKKDMQGKDRFVVTQ